MTETPDQTPEAEDERQPGAGVLFRAPKDAEDDIATGYAVYDRVLGRYVGPVTEDKPAQSAIKSLVGRHPHKVVRV